MIVHDFDLKSVAVPPHETNAPLVVDSDAVPASAISVQRFEPVAPWNSQIAKFAREMDLVKFPPRDALYVPKLSHPFPVKKLFRVGIAE